MKPRMLIRSLGLVAGLVMAQFAMAQAPAGAPAGATGLCKDGTYYTGASKQGACRGHQGVKNWYAGSATTAITSGKGAPAAGATAAPASTSKAAPTSTASPVSTTTKSSAPATTSRASTMAQTPGGGAGKVWLNSASKVYHCPGSKYYGKTKAGAYMSEADAKAKGGHPDHGEPCSK